LTTAHINAITSAVPPHDVHRTFIDFAADRFQGRKRGIFDRMVGRCGIEHRYSCLAPARGSNSGAIDAGGVYVPGAFPDTATRMRLFEQHAPDLAAAAVSRLAPAEDLSRVTHLIVTCCTGFSAPGIDLDIVQRCGLRQDVERTIVGFMGCYAAINALRLARHVVRSQPDARVLVVNIELCTLHLQQSEDLEQVLSFLLFADGCTAAIVSGETRGLSMESFKTVLARDTRDLITWTVRNSGFDMVLSGQVPGAITDALRGSTDAILGGSHVQDFDHWAVHPGGRSVLDAVESALELEPEALAGSRGVLRDYGNMSSATVMFVLQQMLESRSEGRGCAMAFGPGLVAETMLFDAHG
jgi:alpha-pyrone synthase